MGNEYKVLVGEPEGRRPFGIGVDDKIISKWLLKK
jgi:hypothetical protein